MIAKSLLALVSFVCVSALQAGCEVPGGTFSTLVVAVHGAGRVTSDDGVLDCYDDPTGRSGQACEFRKFVAWADPTSHRTFQLRATPLPGSDEIFEAWDLDVAADCPGCGADDPDMGGIDTQGDEAFVTIDMNPGYDVTETVTANFGPAEPSPPSTVGDRPRTTTALVAP